LHEDGVCIIRNLLTKEMTNKIKEYINAETPIMIKEEITKSENIKSQIREILGSSYVFHDYIFLIKKSQIHTCHRDYNGDFFNENQKYPSYTIIIYLENMEKSLDVIPKSHKSRYNNMFNLTDNTETIVSNAGDAILFNGNLIHTGTVNDKEDNMRIQMKISHVDDQETLGFYQNYNKILNKTNLLPKWWKHLQKHISCQFPVIGNYSQNYDFDSIQSNKKSENYFFEKAKSLYSRIMYGDKNFYELDNIPQE